MFHENKMQIDKKKRIKYDKKLLIKLSLIEFLHFVHIISDFFKTLIRRDISLNLHCLVNSS